MARRTGKTRAWAFLIYPDSWPSWEDDLRGLHMPVLVSPPHDRDVYEEDGDGHRAGDTKKIHRHAVVSWNGPASMNAALSLLEPFGVKYVEPVGSYPAYCRYLCHLDDPDKAQYDPSDVVCISGAVPDFERKLTDSEMLAMRDEILNACEENGIVEYADLCDYCRYHRQDWRQDVYTHTIFWRGYFASVRSRIQQG